MGEDFCLAKCVALYAPGCHPRRSQGATLAEVVVRKVEGTAFGVLQLVELYHHGSIVVAYINNEFTIKYLDLSHREEGYIELRPANPLYQPIRILPDDDFEVWGVVIFTIKNHDK